MGGTLHRPVEMPERIPRAAVAVAGVATAVVLVADGPRTALLAAAAGTAIVVTGLRFAVIGAATVLALSALIALPGHGPGRDDRHRSTGSSQHAAPEQRPSRHRRHER